MGASRSCPRPTGDKTARQCETAEVEALRRRIVAKARAAGLRVGDNDNW
ncbi:hypothetical protein [Skermanella stibiiresistens]|nr:hypothetical protein [Skermanella stibiiresistens]